MPWSWSVRIISRPVRSPTWASRGYRCPPKFRCRILPSVRAIKERAPCLEFAHALRRFLGVQFGHAPIVEVLAAAHRIGEMDPPVIAIVDIGQCCRDAAFGHHGMRFAQQRFADHPHLRPGGCRLRWRRAGLRRLLQSPAHRRRTVGIPASTGFSSHARCPSNRGGRRYRKTQPKADSPTPTSCVLRSGSSRSRRACAVQGDPRYGRTFRR